MELLRVLKYACGTALFFVALASLVTSTFFPALNDQIVSIVAAVGGGTLVGAFKILNII